MRLSKYLLMGCVPAFVAMSVYFWSWLSLPEPSQADRDGLAKWLLFTDLSEQDADTQLALLDRLQEEFADGENMSAQTTGLTESLQSRLDRNLAFMQRFWFFTRTSQLREMSTEAKDAFLDAQITFAERWGDLAPSSNDQPDVFDLMDDWIASAEGESKLLAQDGVREALSRFLRTRQLTAYPHQLRLELANRIVEDLESGARLEGRVEADSDEEEALKQNGLLLLQAWLADQAIRYASLPTKQRVAYLDLRIQQIRDWGLLDVFATQDNPNPTTALLAFAAKTKEWVEQADETTRPALELLFRDIGQRLLFGGR